MKAFSWWLIRWLAPMVALACCVALDASEESEHLNVSKKGLALVGYDPVSYFKEGGPMKGKESLSREMDGVRYLFVSDANREEFSKTPDHFQPAFGGWCAWAMLDGDKVEVDPLSYRIFEKNLFVFYNGFWGDTRVKWEKKSMSESEGKLYQQALKEWREIVDKRAK